MRERVYPKDEVGSTVTPDGVSAGDSNGGATEADFGGSEGARQSPLDKHSEIVGQPQVRGDSDSVASSSQQQPENHPRQRSIERRNRRWDLMRLVWELSALKRVKTCGRYSVLRHGVVQVRQQVHGDGTSMSGYGGLASCGSVWACPRCNSKIMAERRLEIGLAIAVARSQGLAVAFGTVTLRHRPGQSLGQLYRALSKGMEGVRGSSKVKKLRQKLGRVGYIRVVEVTYGDNGWHPHIHTLQFFEKKDVTQHRLDELADAEFSVWKLQAAKRGLGEPLRKFYRLDLVAEGDQFVDDYVCKMGSELDPVTEEQRARKAAFEMTGAQTKKGRSGSMTAWQLLTEFAETGNMDFLELWNEYELATKGKRALVWSPGLRGLLLDSEEERSDQRIAGDEVGDEEDTIFWITDWSVISRNPVLAGLLLAEVDRGGLAGGLAFCRDNGIPTVAGDSMSYDSVRSTEFT